jgi:tetratricopeptide (TPR) repeat protein
MTEHTGNTQPLKPLKEDDTQPVKPVKKPSRWRSILIGMLGFLLLIGLGGYSGYSAGIGDRLEAEKTVLSQQMMEQYQYALVDIEFGRYEVARQRLEFIIQHDPTYPGVSEKLTEVLVLISVPTPTPVPTLTPTPDFSGAESAYQRAQQLILAQDWSGALSALDTIRKLDPTYKTAQVDGMYYFALRNYGVDLISKQGNLEGGIYQLSLAERFGPLDRTADGLREGARLYITGASFWELDWSQAVTYFSQVGLGWPSLWDGTMQASQRYYIASMRYGDELFERQQYCEAYAQYQNAAAMGALESPSASHSQEAYTICYPATPTLEPTATTEFIPPTDTPTETPTP